MSWKGQESETAADDPVDKPTNPPIDLPIDPPVDLNAVDVSDHGDHEPRPGRRSWWLWLLLLVLVALIAAAGWLYRDWSTFQQAPLLHIGEAVEPDGLVYTVKTGTHVRAITRDLLRRGWLQNKRQAWYLEWVARRAGLASRLKAGEYALSAQLRPLAFWQLLSSGRVLEYRLTVIEGTRFSEMVAKLEAQAHLSHELKGLSEAEVMARLGHPGEHPEGRFFPDTYRFPKGMSDVALLKRAYRLMQQQLAQAWAKRDPDLPYQSPYEALIMASIIEKETGAAHERAQIAGVFVRRLRKGMRLQTDPTVIYGMGAAFKGNIRRKDLRRDTPYNTYTRHGLPPTPIALPGRAAIEAALHPAPGTALYFVAKGDGTHVFSDTLKAHNRAVRHYQLKRKKP